MSNPLSYDSLAEKYVALQQENAALKARVVQLENAMIKIIVEPQESLSDGKCMREMLRIAKKVMGNKK